ncbi:MAG: hypothetical protein FWG54_04310, partial [Bacteroidetes bacterium]|nr:hypothetical protein [Bacteroidota bacterium]
RIADAMYVNKINERADGIYWEFFSDGLIHYYIPQTGPNDQNGFINTDTYIIDADSLVCNGISYRYGFYENVEKLKLVRAGWVPSTFPPKVPEGEYINLLYITNIIILQRR